MYEIYLTTIEKKYGSAYLNREFFQALAASEDETLKSSIVFMVAYDAGIELLSFQR